MVLTDAQLDQIETHITTILPRILTRNPEISTIIEGILAQHFPRRDEFARLLDELTNHHFEMAEFQSKTVEFQNEMLDFRDKTEKKFKQIDERFDKVDERLDKVDERLDKIDGRLDKVDGRLDKVESSLLTVRRDIARIDSGQQNIIKRLDNQQAWFTLQFGSIGNEIGSMTEDLVAQALRFGLEDPDIDGEQIQLRRTLHDPEGQIFPAGYKSEIDIIARNGSLVVFEVKGGRIKPGDVGLFRFKIDLLAIQNPDKVVEGILIAAGYPDYVREECEQYGIRLIG